MNKRVTLILKILVLAVVLGWIGYKIADSWQQIAQKNVAIQWSYLAITVAGFAGSMLISGLVWRLLAYRMGDRSPTLGLIGAYTFSQMGKYVPGKVMLLLMRIERAGRVGMRAQVCTLSTLLENALYVISGGLAGLLALLLHARELAGTPYAWVLPASAVFVAMLIAFCHPAIFYGVVNVALRKMKKEHIPPAARLRMGTLCVAVFLFLGCWACGGVALWAAARSVTDQIAAGSVVLLMGAFALSVVLGMLSMLPGGLGIREAILILFLTWELTGPLGPAGAQLAALVAVGLQRLAQIVTEVGLGLAGAALTASGRAAQPVPVGGPQ